MTFMFILWLVVLILLVLISAIIPLRAEHSEFELNRRKLLGDGSIKLSQQRESLALYILSIRNIICSLLLVIAALLIMNIFGWPIGIVISIIIAIEYGFIGQIGFIRRLVAKLYAASEIHILKFTKKTKKYIKYFNNVNAMDYRQEKNINSKEELIDLIDNKMSVLTPKEKRLIVNGLQFEDKTIRDIMTPASDMVTIDKSEFLGPLTLSELHKSGHSKLPVIDKNINNIVGILNIKDLLSLEDKKSSTAEKAMQRELHSTSDSASLYQTLETMLNRNIQMMIVADDNKKTLGIVTLTDLFEAIMGEK